MDFFQLVMSQNDSFSKTKKYQSNSCFKLMLKLVFFCHITKIVVGNYDFKLFKKVKTVITALCLMLKPLLITTILKFFKIIVIRF